MPVIVDHLSVKLSTGSITDTMPYSICVGKWEQTILWGYKTLFSTPLASAPWCGSFIQNIGVTSRVYVNKIFCAKP